jgi:phosphoribosylamine--glycine ligase/phosphoribosylformylglycinamidine cyclo-ligase
MQVSALIHIRNTEWISIIFITGKEVVVEEYLVGSELSVLAFSDGYCITPLPAAQDHKRIGEGDTGPNTGGMGVYSPAPIATPPVMDQIMKEVLRPTIDGMRKEGLLV